MIAKDLRRAEWSPSAPLTRPIAPGIDGARADPRISFQVQGVFFHGITELRMTFFSLDPQIRGFPQVLHGLSRQPSHDSPTLILAVHFGGGGWWRLE